MPAPTLRLGVFGGTFNPIHFCHLRVADRVRQLLALDRILFIPAATPPHKMGGDLAPVGDRFEMTRLAVAPWPDFEVDDLELQRTGPSYSVDTMTALRRREPDAALFFLVGIEMFMTWSTWREPDRILALSQVVVMARAGRPFSALAGLPWLAGTSADALSGFDAIDADAVLPLAPDARVVLVKTAPCEMSSTRIRLDLAAGRLKRNELPAPVHRYILERKLYGAREAEL